jgi:hypothetical protein
MRNQVTHQELSTLLRPKDTIGIAIAVEPLLKTISTELEKGKPSERLGRELLTNSAD